MAVLEKTTVVGTPGGSPSRSATSKMSTIPVSAGPIACLRYRRSPTQRVPLRISDIPVVIPVESQYPLVGIARAASDPHPRFIDPGISIADETIKELFTVYEEAIGFYLLINGRLQIIVPDDFDFEYAFIPSAT